MKNITKLYYFTEIWKEKLCQSQAQDQVCRLIKSFSVRIKQGIGRSSAVAFAKRGCHVAVVDLNVEGGNQTVKMVRDIGVKSIFIKADISNSKGN